MRYLGFLTLALTLSAHAWGQAGVGPATKGDSPATSPLPEAPSSPTESGELTYGMRAGTSLLGVAYSAGYPAYGILGMAGPRLEFSLQRGQEHGRFHWLSSLTWSPLSRTPFPGDLALVTSLGFRDDTHPSGPTAFLLEVGGTTGLIRNVYGKEEAILLGLRVGLGARIYRTWELLASWEVSAGAGWDSFGDGVMALRGNGSLVLGRSF